MNSYPSGATIRFTCTFQVGGVLTDPTAITFKLRQPSGAIATYTYGVGGTIARDSLGAYHADLAVSDGVGEAHYRWEGTGAAPGVGEGSLLITGGAF